MIQALTGVTSGVGSSVGVVVTVGLAVEVRVSVAFGAVGVAGAIVLVGMGVALLTGVSIATGLAGTSVRINFDIDYSAILVNASTKVIAAINHPCHLTGVIPFNQ